MRAVPAARGVQRYDQRRHAYGECRGSSSAAFQVAPSSSLISTFSMSGAPEKAKPLTVFAAPAFARFGTVVMFDFTASSVSGRISSGLNDTPGSPGVSGYRYAVSM